MPDFTLRWTNRSNVEQDWAIHPVGDDFTLQPNFSRAVRASHGANYTYQIAVSTTNTFGAANLTYTAATNSWTLNSHTPNEFQLDVNGATVRVTCTLRARVEMGDDSTYEPIYEPAEESAGETYGATPEGSTGESAQLDGGTCYRLSDCKGDVLAQNVTKDDCFRLLGGKSWKKTGTTRCWEN